MKRFKDILLCSEDIIKTYTSINDNTSTDYILPAMYMAQKTDLEQIIGSKLLHKLQELVGTGGIDDYDNEQYKELLDDYVSDYLAYATIVRLIPIVSFKVGNMGVVTTGDEKVDNMSFDEVFSLKDYYQNQTDYLCNRLQKYLIANYNDFKELSETTTIEDLRSQLYSSATSSIWLGGIRGK